MLTRATLIEYCETNEIEILLLPEEYDCAIVGLVAAPINLRKTMQT